MIDGPIVMRWQEVSDANGEVVGAMVPVGRFAIEAARRYLAGATYALDEVQERSSASHAHYFAAVNEAFRNLPEALAERFRTAEHLRKYALIKAGYRDERTVLCSSKAEAQRVAAFISPMDEYAVVSVAGTAVVVLTPKSQSMRAMGKEAFKASKDAVLDVLADLIGVAPSELQHASAA